MQTSSQPAETEEAPKGQPAPQDVDAFLGPYKVGDSDVLQVSLVGAADATIPATFQARVDRDGSIDLPVAGSVDVAGKTLEDVEDTIQAAYVPKVIREVLVHVEVVESEMTHVLVVGAVTDAGLIALKRNQRNMLYAIVGAGGASDIASGFATLRRLRHPDELETFDFRDPVQVRQGLALAPLEDGDIVNVHRAPPNTVFVGGLVNYVGPQNYPANSEITILQVLAAAGGVRTDVFPKEGTLIHRMPNGADTHVKLDLNRLACGADPNITLAAGDILWVPETWDTRVEDFINKNIFLRAGVSVNYNVTGIEFMNRSQQQSSRSSGGSQQDISDPFGFLGQNSALQQLQSTAGR